MAGKREELYLKEWSKQGWEPFVERLLKNDVKYRFVIDIASLK